MSELFKTVTLDRLRVGISQRLSAELPFIAETAAVEWLPDHIADQMIVALRAHVLAEKLPPQTISHHVRITVDVDRHAPRRPRPADRRDPRGRPPVRNLDP